MIVYIIFVQRRERYPGEHAPEALECQDQFGREENPDFLDEKMAEYRKDEDLLSVKLVPVVVSDAKLDEILAVASPHIEGKIDTSGVS